MTGMVNNSIQQPKVSRLLVGTLVLSFLVWPVLLYIPDYFQFSSIPLTGFLWSGLIIHIIAVITSVGLSSLSEHVITRQVIILTVSSGLAAFMIFVPLAFYSEMQGDVAFMPWVCVFLILASYIIALMLLWRWRNRIVGRSELSD